MFLHLNTNKDKLHLVSKNKYEDLGLIVVEVPDDFNYKKTIVEENKEVLVSKSASEILESITYFEKRVSEYPKLEEQLDMIYKDMLNGTSNWQDLITSIKDKYPKEE